MIEVLVVWLSDWSYVCVLYRSRALRVGDCIVAVNDESVVNKTLSETLELLQSASETVSLKINKRMKTKLS